MYKLIRIYLEPEHIKFDTTHDVDEFHKAVGRMVMFGLPEAGSQDVQLIEMHVAQDKEVTGCYHTVVRQSDNYKDNAKFYALDDAITQFKQPHPFVVGAVPRKEIDGTTSWSFHS